MKALEDARVLAEALLAEVLPERWVHVRAVADMAHLYPDEMDRWADRLGEIVERMWPERGQSDDNDDDQPPSAASAGR